MTVLVSTIRALKYHGFIDKKNDNKKALKDGLINISKHVDILKSFNIPYLIVINHFSDDTKEEIDYLLNWANKNNHPISFVNSYAKGSIGALDAANKIVSLSNNSSTLIKTYNKEDDLFTKANKVATKIYGANQVKYSKNALKKLKQLNINYHSLPICIAKTPLSFSNNPKLRAQASNFDLEIDDVRLSRGAGFVVLLTKGIITLPGLPKKPNALDMFINDDGIIYGKL